MNLNLFSALLSGNAQAKNLLKFGTKEQKKVARNYLKKEKELKKFYSKRKSFGNLIN